MYPFGLIGNCQIAALVSQEGSLDWLCLPRPDSPPVFGRLLDGAGGHFSISGVGAVSHQQEYIRNTNVLVTTITTKSGDQFRITDFCPRFSQFGRMFRPFSVFRIVEPIKGQPQIKVECQPVVGWEKEPVPPVRGSSHLRFDIRGESLRLWSSMPMTYLAEGQPFLLTEKTYFALSWSSAMEENLAEVSEDFLRQTVDYWRNWVRHCSIPSEYQSETIRSALALKLHCYEDTGAILAALTTSLPEEVGGTRNWDYRFCWLRDASFVLNAFHQLGHFEEMEGFLKFLISVVKANEDAHERLRPVYALDRSVPLPEAEHLNWAGWAGCTSPVRSKNQAAEHVQNDVYGEMLVALAPIFLDERFYHLRTPENEEMIEHLVAFCVKNISKPDAGLWELRDGWREHSFSNLLCWAGLDRAVSIRDQGFLNGGINLEKARAEAEASVRKAAFDGAVGNGPEDPTMDASLLFLPLLRFPDKKICRDTVLKIEEELTFILDGKRHEGFLYRYLRKDDFGRPQSAFLICSYWLVQALARVGEKDRARKLMEKLSVSANSIGLLAEHFEPGPNKQLGNFPQAYSHTGQILAAFAVSRPWDEVL